MWTAVAQKLSDLPAVCGFEVRALEPGEGRYPDTLQMLNEPHRGYVGLQSLHEFVYETDLHLAHVRESVSIRSRRCHPLPPPVASHSDARARRLLVLRTSLAHRADATAQRRRSSHSHSARATPRESRTGRARFRSRRAAHPPRFLTRASARFGGSAGRHAVSACGLRTACGLGTASRMSRSCSAKATSARTRRPARRCARRPRSRLERLTARQFDWYEHAYFPFVRRWADTVRAAAGPAGRDKMIFAEPIPNEVHLATPSA
jgi:hypothetical protein